jgi:hypothetical protein
MSTEIEAYIAQSIPHESGHILVGRILGIPVSKLKHEVLDETTQIRTGNFATAGLAPMRDPLVLRTTPPDVIHAYKLYVGGGLAGNLVSGIAATEHGLAPDRYDLSFVTDATLEEVAESSRVVIAKRMDIFEELQAAFKDSYQKLIKNGQLPVGTYTLLTSKQLEEICPQNKAKFPAAFYEFE